MSQKISPKLIALTFGVLALCFLATLYIFAWTEPSVAPPGGNVAPPINVGPSKQWKLWVSGAAQKPAIGVSVGTSAPYTLTDGAVAANIFTDSDNINYYINPAATGAAYSAILAGRVGIGTTSPAASLQVGNGSMVAQGLSDVVGSPTGVAGIEIGYVASTQGVIRAAFGAFPENTFLPLDLQGPSVWVGGTAQGTPTLAPPSPYYSLEIRNEPLGTAIGNQMLWQRLYGRSNNNDQLRIFHNRYAAGSDWSSAEIKIQKTVDVANMHYITFRGNSGFLSSLNFGYGTTDQVTILQNGNVGIGRTPTANRLEVAGTASKAAAGDWLANSDIRIKTDIQDIGNALDVINMLRPVKFRYSEEYMLQYPSITDHYYYNFIAQDFQKVFPDFVQDNGEGYLQIDTYPVTPYLVAAVQELNKTIEQLKAENNELKARIEALENR